MAEGSGSGAQPPPPSSDPHTTDPPLLAENSSFHTYTTSQHTYPSIRVFHRPHPRASELPPLPLLVFVHGLGGSVAQFHPLLSSLAPVAPCLSVDLPGCGRSAFVERSWAAYVPRALVELLALVIAEHRAPGQNVVLVGHSMGTSLCALLGASPGVVRENLAGIVAVCPAAAGPKPMSRRTLFLLRMFFWVVPGWAFDLWRKHDRRGGPESASVARFVGKGASAELKAMQARFNEQSKTPVWRRMAYACLPWCDWRGKRTSGLAGREEWEKIGVPVFLVGGEDDTIASPKQIDDIAAFLRGGCEREDGAGKVQSLTTTTTTTAVERDTIPDSAAPVDVSEITPVNPSPSPPPSSPGLDHPSPTTPDSDSSTVTPTSTPSTPPNPLPVVETLFLPSPANHTLLYHPSISRTLSGLVSDFLSTHVGPQLSLGWQLQHLSREGKWDVKNLAKWKLVAPVSGPIGPPGPSSRPLFRAIKTLREADEDHCPSEFVARWAGVISDVVDIGSDRPVYDPWGLERAGVRYHKFPTVSKVPPSPEEVRGFIEVIDRVRAERALRVRAASKKGDDDDNNEADSTNDNEDRGDSTSTATASRDVDRPDKDQGQHNTPEDPDDKVIGVHCHYGFNRTGYFLVCYLVERCGVPVHEAIKIFADARPNGIRHPHFLDRLYVRYQPWGDGRA